MQMSISPVAERYTFKQVAKLVGVNLATVWRWTLHGVRGRKLRSIHVGGRRFVLAADLEEFLNPPADKVGPPVGAPLAARTESAMRELERQGI